MPPLCARPITWRWQADFFGWYTNWSLWSRFVTVVNFFSIRRKDTKPPRSSIWSSFISVSYWPRNTIRCNHGRTQTVRLQHCCLAWCSSSCRRPVITNSCLLLFCRHLLSAILNSRWTWTFKNAIGSDIYGNSKLIIYQCISADHSSATYRHRLPPPSLRTAIGRFIKIGRWCVGSRAVAGRVLESGS